jgi:LSD1 subclass zinc finger protein
MAVMLLCPNLRCRKVLSVPEEVRGKTVKCQHCQTVVRVPEKAVAAPAAGKH